jgi:hypothetical protein
MTKNKSKPILLLATGMLWAGIAQAQESANTSGGDATGSGGTVAYSIGQIVYTTHTGSTGSIAQGVQQPYEISIVAGVEDHQISLNLKAFPNPTTNYLTLTIDNIELSNLSYRLFDIGGKLLETKKITSTTETIQMENLPGATYFLNVMNNNKEIKTFKIVKYH